MQRNYRYYEVNDITSSGFLFCENENEGELLEGRLSQKFTRVAQRIRSEAFSLMEKTVAGSDVYLGGLRMI